MMEAPEPVIVDNTEKCDDKNDQPTALDAALTNDMVNNDAINVSVVDDPVNQEDLEEGEIEDDEEEEEQEAPPPPVKSSDSNSAISQNDPDDDKSDASSAGGEERRRSSRKGRKDRSSKRSDRSLRKELEDDEAKKRAIKEKIRELELQMADEDEEELGVYSSGASPSRRKRLTSDSTGSTGSGDRSRSPSPTKRRRRDRGDSRERDRKRRRGDDDDRSSRGDRRMNQGGLNRKSLEVCKLFMQGKCPKNPQTCLYSHDADPPKIMELCKFYLLERCAKREKCLYLHKGFPCKYFHTGHNCMETAESCKFSHGPLSDITRGILLKHLETAPKEILGDFPRLTREAATALVYAVEAKNKGWSTEKAGKGPTRSAGDSLIENPKMQSQLVNNLEGYPPPLFGMGNELDGTSGGGHQRKSRWGDSDGGDENTNNFSFPPPAGPPPMFPPPFGRGGGGSGPRGMNPRMMRAPPPNTGPGLLGEAPGIPNPANMIPSLRFPPGFVPPQGFPNFAGGDQVENMQNNPRMSNDEPVRETTPTPDDEDEDLAFGSGKDVDTDEPETPHAQKRLYEKIQQKQKERKASLDAVKQTNPVFNEENWYSSDEEDDGHGPSKRVKIEVKEEPQEQEVKQKRDPRMSRDPRQRQNPPPVSDDEKDKRILDIDFSDLADLDIPTFTKKEEPEEEELENELGLPFKPHKVHSVAKEIDASIYSHSPLEYKLRSIVLSKPDYTDMIFKQRIPASKIQVDPRLRRYAGKKPAAEINDSLRSKPSQNAMTEDNVYNPKKDLYHTPQGPSRGNDAQDFYDPSDEVQDLYGSGGKGQPEERPNVYNPRQELGQFQGSGPWSNNGNHGGYGGGPSGGFNMNEAPGPMPRPMSKDPRANRRDPRRRD